MAIARCRGGPGILGDLFHHGEFHDVDDGHMVCREGAADVTREPREPREFHETFHDFVVLLILLMLIFGWFFDSRLL